MRAWSVGLAVVFWAQLASAHVIYAHETLRRYLANSELSLWVEFTGVDQRWQAADGADRVEYFSVRVIEALRGGPPQSTQLDFFVHAHGSAAWQVGDRALVFLEYTATRPEFAARAERFAYFSTQPAGKGWRASEGEAPKLLSVAKGYVTQASAEQGGATYQAILLEALQSDVELLQNDAIAELVLASRVPGFLSRPEQVSAFARLTKEPEVGFATRIALIKLLEGRPGFDADSRLFALTKEPLDAVSRRTLFKSAGLSKDPRLSQWLVSQLAQQDPILRRDAAYALGRPWHSHQVPALTKATQDSDPRVAQAAVRALGGVGDEAALDALRRVAGGRDQRLGRLARAELSLRSKP